MMPMRLALVAVLAAPVFAQDFLVTGLAGDEVTGLESDARLDGESLQIGDGLTRGVVEVISGQLMLFDADVDVALVIVASRDLPARVEISRDFSFRVDSGVVLVDRSPQSEVGIEFLLVRPSAFARTELSDAEAIAIVPSTGRSAVLVSPQLMAIGVAPGSGNVSVGVDEVEADEVAYFRPDGTRQDTTWAQWEALQQDIIWARGAALASAQASRRGIEENLFDNITEWDRYAAAEQVVQRLRPDGVDVEIRQTIQVASDTTSSASRTTPPVTQGVAAANQVPIVSPAAASVSGVTNVTALNSQADRLLSSTGSRGLFLSGGIQRLSVPAFQGAGQRTPGPAGLAGTDR